MLLTSPRAHVETFATPSENASTSQLFADAVRGGLDRDPLLFIGGALSDALRDVYDRPDHYARIVSAAERQARLVDTTNAEQSALQEAADRRIQLIQEQTGVQLENPFRDGYAREARDRVLDNLRRQGNFDPAALAQNLDLLTAEQRNIFNEKLSDLAEKFPDKAGALSFYQPFEDQARAIAKSANAESDALAQERTNGLAGFVAEIAGGIWGSRRDPIFIASLFFGPGKQVGESVAMNIAKAAIKSGLANAGAAAVMQPSVQAWREELGARHGLLPALENVGMSFLFGAIPGAGVQGLLELSPKAKTSLQKVTDGTATPAETLEALEALKKFIPDEERGVVNTAREAEELAAAAADTLPPAVPPAIADDILAQAVRHAENPDINPPAEIAVLAPPRPEAQARVIDEALPPPAAAQVIDNKPVTFERFDPKQLEADAATFQYKGGGDSAGVTDRLKNVETWDPLASGKTLVWERADGQRFVADGHQRLGLAKRLEGQSPKLDGYLFREKDGWSPSDVRAIAAKKNMQEGSGDAIDAARVLRDRPDLLDSSLPLSSPMMRQALALTRLSDEAFGMAVNGMVPANYAAAVGAMVPDPLSHAAVLSDLIRFAPETERAAKLLIGEILAAGFRAEQQIDLFGASVATRSLMMERVRVLDRAIADMAKDRKLFGVLAARADTIEAAGNRLDRAANASRAGDAGALAEIIARVAQRTGPVSDLLNRAAQMLADGRKVSDAARAFLDEVRVIVDRDGLSAILAEPELKPRFAAEPGTPESLSLFEGPAAPRADSPAGPAGKIADEGPEKEKTAPRTPEGQERPISSGQPDGFFGAVPQADTEGRLITPAAALDDAGKPAFYADLLKSCKD